MADIYHNFQIGAPVEKVFEAVISEKGLDNWWTKTSSVNAEPGGIYIFHFGPGYDWQAVVSKFTEGKEFEWTITDADADWLHTKVGFVFIEQPGKTLVNFYHTGWPQNNNHFKTSGYCWAMYLRILKRFVELGGKVPYEKRLHV